MSCSAEENNIETETSKNTESETNVVEPIKIVVETAVGPADSVGNVEIINQELYDELEEALEVCTNEKANANIYSDSSDLSNGMSEAAILKLRPVHQKLQNEMLSLQCKCNQQAERISQLQQENHNLREELSGTINTPPEIYEVQMEALEKTISNMQKEIASLHEKLASHDEIAKKTITQLKQDSRLKLEKMTNMYETANKDKELMVIKYAHGQKEVITLKKLQEDIEKKFRDGVLDIKSSEISNLMREGEKMKEQLSSKEIKLKWAQSKLRTEMDAHKETETKLDRVQQKLQQTREEADQIRKDCQEMIKTYQESEDVRSNSLDLQLKVKETELEKERQGKTNQEEVYHSITNEFETIKKKHRLTIEENNNLIVKIQTLEGERLEYENNLSRFKDTVNLQNQEIVDFKSKISEMDNLKAMLEREKGKFEVSNLEIERIRQTNSELLLDMDACRNKEGELLEFTERLTSKNVMLQSEFAVLESKSQMLSLEKTRLVKLSEELENQIKYLKSQVEEEKQLRQQETQLLARKLAEKTKTAESLSIKLEEEANENRELTREIQSLKRKLDLSESTHSVGNNLDPTTGLNSRASSSGSLDTITNSGSGFNNPTLTNPPVQRNVNNSHMDNNVITIEPSRQLLIERIVKLQKSLARKNEKIEFLDEHARQLITELRKKSKIIQSYVMKLEAGALVTEQMDQNKIDLAKRGGIMASLYNSQASDGAMTFELSLEINRKLQAVLEDTLLKNITLKVFKEKILIHWAMKLRGYQKNINDLRRDKFPE
uniref:Coiled-coil domain-containing protein 186 n=1 Tax=Strigamia maritima TaxID=126957 RepID=T1JNM1_STRMM